MKSTTTTADAASAASTHALSSDGSIHASVSIDVKVESLQALHDAAFSQYARANGHRSRRELVSEFDDMYGTTGSLDVTGLIRLLFDTGSHLPGVSVQDSFATVHSAPAA
jgi:hypothetical protein